MEVVAVAVGKAIGKRIRRLLDSKGILRSSATDPAGHLSCNHLTQLDAEIARGVRAKPKSWDPLLEILRKRGDLHEQAYLDHLEGAGHGIVRIDGVGLGEKHAEKTVAAMRPGVAIINQGVLLDGRSCRRPEASG